MGSTIESFLKIKPQSGPKTEEVPLTIQGQDVVFKIKAIDPELLGDIQVANTISIPSSVQGGPSTEGVNPIRFALDLCTEAIVEPNLNSHDLHEHFGTRNARDTVHELFKYDIEQLNELFTKALALANAGAPETRGPDDGDIARAKN